MYQQTKFVISSFQALEPGVLTDEWVACYAAAGFNMLESNMPASDRVGWQSLSPADQDRLMTLCAAHGIGVLVVDHQRFTGRQSVDCALLDEATALYSGHPGFAGYYLWDEPKPENFPDVRRMQDHVATVDPAHLPYTVLLPSYGPYAWEENSGNPSFPEYVRQFIHTVDPPVLAFDYYPFSSRGFKQRYWSDLGIMRREALRFDKPLWIYIQSCGWGGMLAPSPAQLRFQAWMAVAYGARGIQYFVYHEVTTATITFGRAVVQSDGTPGPLYPETARLNSELAILGPTLIGLNSRAIIHTDPTLYALETASDISELAPVVEASPGLVLSLFEDCAGQRLLLVANKSWDSATAARIVLASPHRIQEVSKTQPDQVAPLDAVSAPRTVFELSLEPGDARLLILLP